MNSIVTRFNPTTNGNLHLGHFYTIMVNERFAHERGGKFYVRFDDTDQAVLIEMDRPERAKDIAKSQREIIEWLEIEVDGWSYQSELLDDVHMVMNKSGVYIPPDPYPHTLPVSFRMKNNWIPYPYTPYQTAERVIMDHWIGTTHLIRGEDFMTEYGMYRYYCDAFNHAGFDFTPPFFYMLPRLEGKFGDISKTNGGYTIAELRGSGYSPKEIKKLLEVACLGWYENGWDLYNLKPNPRVNI